MKDEKIGILIVEKSIRMKKNKFNLSYVFIAFYFGIGMTFNVFAGDGKYVKLDGGSEVKTCGLLNINIYPGPPGFGENPEVDAKEEIYIINLDKYIIFNSVDEFGMIVSEKLERIQIIPSDIKWKLSKNKFVRKYVSVKGRIWPATSEGDKLPANILFNSIKIVGSCNDDK